MSDRARAKFAAVREALRQAAAWPDPPIQWPATTALRDRARFNARGPHRRRRGAK